MLRNIASSYNFFFSNLVFSFKITGKDNNARIFLCQGVGIYRLFFRPFCCFYLEQRKIILEFCYQFQFAIFIKGRWDYMQTYRKIFFLSLKCLICLYIFSLLYKAGLSLGFHFKIISSLI